MGSSKSKSSDPPVEEIGGTFSNNVSVTPSPQTDYHARSSTSFTNAIPMLSANEALSTLADSLIYQDHRLRGNEIANDIFNILRRGLRCVDRVIIGGSIGRKTAVGDKTDFDLVLFLNNREPPFDSTLVQMKYILEKEKSKLKNYKFREECVSDIFISFYVDGYKFDVSPAANYKVWSSNPEFVYLSQLIGTLNKIQHLKKYRPDDCRLYGAGLTEYSVKFSANQSGFVHSVIRLAKYWNGEIDFKLLAGQKVYISGRGLIIELLAINACRTVNENNIYKCFKQFLFDVAHLNEQFIYFTEFYTESYIPKHYFNEGGRKGAVIIDPTNYHNNLAINIWWKPMAIFKSVAKESLNKLDAWVKDPNGTEKALKIGVFSGRPYKVFE